MHSNKLFLICLLLFSLPMSVTASDDPLFNGNNPGNAFPSPFDIVTANSETPLTGFDTSFPTETVAIAIYTNGEINSVQGGPVLSGRFAAGEGNSDLSLNNEDDILNDIIKGGNEIDAHTNSDILKVNGVVYSNTGSASFTVIPGNLGSTSFVPNNSISVRFFNITGGSGEIDIAFNGNFLGNGFSHLQGSASLITNTGNTSMGGDNKANFNLTGDVIEASVSGEDDAGVYQGSITITVTAL